MDVAGYMASILIGISLGLIGGGGSILTVPVLVYLFKVDTLLATTYSLFIVGIASIGGSVSYFKKGQVNIKTAILFGLPSIVAVLLTRSYLLPSIPHNIFTLGNFVLTRDIFILLIFGILMILAAFSMIKKNQGESNASFGRKSALSYNFTPGNWDWHHYRAGRCGRRVLNYPGISEFRQAANEDRGRYFPIYYRH